MSKNFYSLLESRFLTHRADIALEIPGGIGYSYADLDAESARYAHVYAGLGLQRGDRLVLQVEKSPAGLFAHLGGLRAGLVVVPLNTAYRDLEIEYFMQNAAPRLVVCAPERLDATQAIAKKSGGIQVLTLDASGHGSLYDMARAQPDTHAVTEVSEDDVAVILYTSGTTGKPKGAMITHQNLAANGNALKNAWGFTASDVLLHALPIFHIHGLFVAAHVALLSACKMIFLPRFDPATIVNQLPRSTVFMGVPTYYTRLLAEPAFGREACKSMRLFTCGSAPLLPQTFREFEARTGHIILERYGMTETGMNCSNPLHGARLAGTVGPALPGVQLRVVDAEDRDLPDGETGQLLVKGQNVFKGYWQLPEKTAEEFTADGFFRTGDLARRDTNGYVSIVGRAKDLIISGGLNIYPKEIEGYLDKLEGVAESAVIGIAHPDFGEAVVAVLVCKPDCTPLTETDICAQLKSQIAGFKVPKRVFVVESLPRNTMGKVQKNVLRESYTKQIQW